MRKTLPLLVGILALAISAGCDDVNTDDFGGVYGMVGMPPIANCEVEIYNALKFKSLDSNAGLITTTTTNRAGRFNVEFSSKNLGRPLIVVARPGPNAMYRDFGAPGNPDVAWDNPRQPWVSVLQEWLGGEDYVTVSPITTMAFHSMMRTPVSNVGGANLRFDTRNVQGANRAVAASFGIGTDAAAGTILPPKGSAFESQGVFYLEDNDRAQSYTYAMLQLALAANDFAATSGNATDNSLDFLEAMFRDAHDGALDGQYFGVAVDHLNQLPAVVGREPSGESSLMAFISTHALSAAQENFVSSARDDDGYDTSPTEIAALVAKSTGSLRRSRVDSFDVQNYPFSGNVVMTIKGQGFRRTDRFVFRSGDDSDAEFIVNRNSAGVDGEFQYHSDSELRMLIPDFAGTTKNVDSNLTVDSGSDFRIVRLILENLPRIDSTGSDVENEITDDARVTNRTEPLLINVEVGRVDAAGKLTTTASGANIYGAGVDPATLDPSTDDVYEMRVRVTNPDPDAINNIGLDLGLSAFRQLGADATPDTFGGTTPGRAVIFAGTPPTVNLNPGDVARLDYRFKFLDAAIPADLAEGAPVQFTPVLSGVSTGAGTPTLTTGDVVGLNRSAELAPVQPDATPQLDALPTPVVPATATAGDSFDIEFSFSASPRTGAAMRNLNATEVDVTITFDGETTLLRLQDAFFETRGESALRFTSLGQQGTGGQAMPVVLTQVANSGVIVLTVQTDPTRTGTLSVSYAARAVEPGTGIVTNQTSAAADVTIAP